MAVARQIVFSIDPEIGISGTFGWDICADGNSDGHMITCAVCPTSKDLTISPLQESLFLGTVGAEELIHTFREDLAQDDGSDFLAEWISARIDPTLEDPELADMSIPKRFLGLAFPEINPLSSATVEVARDAVDPHRGVPLWESVVFSPGDNRAGIESGLADWLHIRIRDNGQPSSDPVFGSFLVEYYETYPRNRKEN